MMAQRGHGTVFLLRVLGDASAPTYTNGICSTCAAQISSAQSLSFWGMAPCQLLQGHAAPGISFHSAVIGLLFPPLQHSLSISSEPML